MDKSTCPECESEFAPSRRAQVYCSKACRARRKARDAYRRRKGIPAASTCAHCGCQFPFWNGQFYCSDSCREKSRYQKLRENPEKWTAYLAKMRERYEPKPPRPTRTCSVPDCDSKHLAKGMCRLHWRRTRYANETGNPIEVLNSMASLRGAYFPKPKPVTVRLTVGVMVDCPACPDIMTALDPINRYCKSCGTTLTLNPEEVSWLTSVARSRRASRQTANSSPISTQP